MTSREDRHRVEKKIKHPVDPRSAFQRDRDRILYTSEFRRLAAVTQVVGSHETELFHNRLTHTLKVAQVAQRIAERLVVEYPAEAIDADVVEAAALAHDIGHPPFGHIAEEKLDELLSVNDHDGFEGNAQSFRIVTELSERGSGRGLNLTRATLQALTKYPWERAPNGKKHRKFGAYNATESKIFTWTRETLKHADRDKQTIEASIMDWSDDVAYALHDLDDFFRAGFVPLDRLARDEPEQARFLDRTFTRWTVDEGRDIDKARWSEYERVAAVLFAEFPSEMGDSAETMANLISQKVNLYSSGLTVSAHKCVEDPDMRMQLDLLKSLTWTYVIESPALAAQQEGQRRIVETLFNYFQGAKVHTLPGWAHRSLDEHPGTESRIACDVVASLSEAQALALFGRITGQRAGSIYEAIAR
ncbi:hypothetical protein ASF62_12060 [Leifsonia sp. Leaf325]|nr:dNTP triphosphohydrolase [Leifsonia sp. Leaf325]KQQ92578.1 hypothetical protein ASF62_12060 [Leifsonia sp. Leaf325]